MISEAFIAKRWSQNFSTDSQDCLWTEKEVQSVNNQIRNMKIFLLSRDDLNKAERMENLQNEEKRFEHNYKRDF